MEKQHTKEWKKNKGITLVALVVTIVVLLILAGLTIYESLTKNGVLDRTADASQATLVGEEEDKIMFKISEAISNTTPQENDLMQVIFDGLQKDDEVIILAKEKGSENNYYEKIEKGKTEGFWVYLKETRGVYFHFDHRFVITKINEIPYAEKSRVKIHKHLFIEKEQTSGCVAGQIKNYQCEKCGYEYHLILGGVTDHEWSDWTITAEPSCSAKGKKEKTCIKCGTKEEEEIPMTAHQYEEWETTVEPTCVAKGKRVRICSKCNEKMEEEIASLGHLPSAEYSHSATDHYKSCQRCGLRLTENEAHTFSSGKCTICGYTGSFKVSYEVSKMTHDNTATSVNSGGSYTTTLTPINSLAYQRPSSVTIRMGGNVITSGYTYNNVNGQITISNITGDVVISAAAERYYGVNTSFTNAGEIKLDTATAANIDQSYRLRIFRFMPETSGTYEFYSTDPVADTKATDPYAYLFDGTSKSVDELDNLALEYSKAGSYTTLQSNCLVYNDDGGTGYNFKMQYNCEAGKTYYLAIRTYTANKIQSFINIFITKK